MSALLPHRYPHLATENQDIAATHTSDPRLHTLLLCWCQEASLSTEHGSPTLTTKPSHETDPTALPKSKNPAPAQSGNLPFFGDQETYFFNVQKGPALPTVPNYRKAPTSPLKTKNARLLTERRKVVTYYSESGTRRPTSQSAQRPSALHCA
jgi:hypothetical protein